jgi:predicted nucleic acid-binding Zn ribbon protein
MQCPFCGTELKPDGLVCDKCGAIKVYRRTTTGVFVGWVGMVIALIWAAVFVPLLFLPFMGFSLSGYPWIILIVGLVLAPALLWYSRSTLHALWIGRDD